MSDHDGLRAEVESLRDIGGCGGTVDRILALLDERDALAARLDRIEHAAREVLAWEPALDGDAFLDDFAALRDALGDDT